MPPKRSESMRSGQLESGRKKIRIFEANTSVFSLNDIGRVCIRIVCFECSSFFWIYSLTSKLPVCAIAYICKLKFTSKRSCLCFGSWLVLLFDSRINSHLCLFCQIAWSKVQTLCEVSEHRNRKKSLKSFFKNPVLQKGLLDLVRLPLLATVALHILFLEN